MDGTLVGREADLPALIPGLCLQISHLLHLVILCIHEHTLVLAVVASQL